MKERKRAHIKLALEEPDHPYFSRYQLYPRALPEVDFEEISTSTRFMNKTLQLPLVISSMTAGIKEAEKINELLASCAEEKGLAMGVGSLRKVIEEGRRFGIRLRESAPTALLFANLGAVQLNYGFGLKECSKAVELMEADALILHLNPMQEAIQPEGNRNFAGLLKKIEQVARALPVPLIIKEVGQGLDLDTAMRLRDAGVRYLDTAGKGGTSFTAIEARRRRNRRLYELFADWGLDTPTSLLQLRKVKGIKLIASGGLRSGLDMAKAIAMGADLTGMAKPLLQNALISYNALMEFVDQLALELKIAMFGAGCHTISELKRAKVFDVQNQTFV